jgi:uncharacterized protein DUF3298
MNKSLKLLFVLLLPIILFAKLLNISSEYFLVKTDSLSPSMTYTYEGEMIPFLTDTSLKIFTDPEAYYKEHYNLYCKDYMTLRDLYDLYPRAASLNYFYEDHTEILYKSKKYISLKHTHFAFTGGAHPNTTMQHWIINKKSGNTLNYNDIFQANTSSIIKDLSDIEIMQHFDTDDLDEILFSSDYQISKDIYVTRKGVVFQYDPYEIAAYAYGSIEVFIPYKKLRSVLR